MVLFAYHVFTELLQKVHLLSTSQLFQEDIHIYGIKHCLSFILCKGFVHFGFRASSARVLAYT